jgi:hypothetical protein
MARKSWEVRWNRCNGRQRLVYLTRDLKVAENCEEDASEG